MRSRNGTKAWTWKVAWLPAVVAVFLLAVPAFAGAPSVADTAWEGPGTLVIKARGEGRKTQRYDCMVYFYSDGVFDMDCDEVGSGGPEESAEPVTWTQHGKRIRVDIPEEQAPDAAMWAYSEVVGRDAVEPVKARLKLVGKLHPKKETLDIVYRMRGKVIDDQERKVPVSFKLKIRGMTPARKKMR